MSAVEETTPSGIVKLLDSLVIDQISAGEVVDRPAAVVRELVDNSVDAGAKSISVYLEDGGQALIRVVDDGSGMSSTDARTAFTRHATSKIRSADDLRAVSTLGFRGEALPSIASVSRVRLRTQLPGQKSGTEITVNGGEMAPVGVCAIKTGTDIEIRSLFYNTPARKKFLRTPRTEEAKVKSWLRHSAVANPHIHYRYFSGTREVFNLPPRLGSVERAQEIFDGASIALNEKIEHFVLEGLVAHPSMAGGDSASFILLINGRLVSDRMIARAVREGFDSTLKSHEYPVGFLSLSIAPHLVDVNVHPQKSEVRFIAPQSVFTLVRSVVKHGVMRFSDALPRRQLQPNYSPPAREYRSPEPLHLVSRADEPEPAFQPSFLNRANVSPASAERPSASIPFSQLRFLGQAFRCYLFAEGDGLLYVVDMHAAHERIMFNKIRSDRQRHEPVSQKLLIPESVEGSEFQRARVSEVLGTLTAIGFEIEVSDEKIRVSAIPNFLVGADLAELFTELASLPEESDIEGLFTEKLDHMMARQACHASVRSGRVLEQAEVYALFEQMEREQLANACPHGRPVVVTFEQAEIEQWFGRDR